MGKVLNWLRRPRRTAAKPAPVNRVEELANSLQHAGRAAELEVELKKIETEPLSPAEREAWWHLYRIAAFREGRDGEALTRLTEAHRRFPSSVSIRFSLGQQCERAGDIDRAFELFEEKAFPELSREYLLAQVRYAYLWNRYAQGRAYLRPFLPLYKKLGILDDHFLYIRGMPFFSRWWDHLAALSVLTNDWAEIEQATEDVSKSCQDYDFDALKTGLAAYRTGNLAAMEVKFQGHLERVDASKFPTGYTQLRLAIARSLRETDHAKAMLYLDAPTFANNDFPWLGDMQVLARAQIASRDAADSELAKSLRAEFLRRQPMLFEPDLALSFFVLRYQESLKPMYQERRLGHRHEP